MQLDVGFTLFGEQAGLVGEAAGDEVMRGARDQREACIAVWARGEFGWLLVAGQRIESLRGQVLDQTLVGLAGPLPAGV